MTLLGKSTVFLVKKSTVQSKLQLEKDISSLAKNELYFCSSKRSSAWIGIIPSDIPHGDENVNDQHELTYQYYPQTPGEMGFLHF